MNPRAAINDLLPFQGSPFGQLGYFSKLPYTIVFRFVLPEAFYIISCRFLFVKNFFNFFVSFLFSTSGESGIRTHAPLRTNGFQDRLVMTTSISLHIYISLFFGASLSAQDIFYHRMFLLSTPNFTFFYIFSKKFLQCRDLPVL